MSIAFTDCAHALIYSYYSFWVISNTGAHLSSNSIVICVIAKQRVNCVLWVTTGIGWVSWELELQISWIRPWFILLSNFFFFIFFLCVFFSIRFIALFILPWQSATVYCMPKEQPLEILRQKMQLCDWSTSMSTQSTWFPFGI